MRHEKVDLGLLLKITKQRLLQILQPTSAFAELVESPSGRTSALHERIARFALRKSWQRVASDSRVDILQSKAGWQIKIPTDVHAEGYSEQCADALLRIAEIEKLPFDEVVTATSLSSNERRNKLLEYASPAIFVALIALVCFALSSAYSGIKMYSKASNNSEMQMQRTLDRLEDLIERYRILEGKMDASRKKWEEFMQKKLDHESLEKRAQD